MLGSIIGNISGSYYKTLEENAIKENNKRKYEDRISILSLNTPLFIKNYAYIDDYATTSIIENNHINISDNIFSEDIIYFSSIAYYYDDLETILKEIEKVASLYNNIEYIKGLHAICTTIYLAKTKSTKDEIKKTIENTFNYNLDFTLFELQHNYCLTSKISNIIPQAIYCFLISNSFEDSIRKSISIGGCSDTIASITGSISEAYYGIPDNLKNEIYTYLSPSNQSKINFFYEELTIKNALKEVDITNQEFIKYMRNHTKRYNLPYEIGIWGCFVKRNEDNIIEEVKIIVPSIISEKTLLINIHEYTHAFQMYKRIGTVYEEDVEYEEKLAIENELLYLKKTYK